MVRVRGQWTEVPLGILLTGFARDYPYEKLPRTKRATDRITLMDESKANIGVLHQVANNTIR